MPTATLTFTLPEETAEHLLALHGADWALVVCELDHWLRGCLKHGHDYPSADGALKAARKLLHWTIGEHGVSLEAIA
jgi:hypothetical protein